ncbi:VC2046/SO_2500 family protein [Aliidiomarina minuta]|nr:VC2046/SO_2500 family protein [Aliidiomarina minuta]
MDAANNTQQTSPAEWIQHEIPLGKHLSEAFQSGRRADFSYLLSLLSTNATESGFARLQRAPQPDQKWQPPFASAPPQPLGASNSDWQRNPSKAIHDSFTSWRLLNALQPEALHLHNDSKALAGAVRDNCSGFVRARWADRESAENLQTEEAGLVDIIDNLRGVDRSAA